ncbi:NADP-dependent oxidoreductase [Spirochaetia bacterium]|nr:NADP-dependent oxidoreductase [Spirochaetia bacterium]
MDYNNLPGTNVKVSKLCLGTMMFGGQTNAADSVSIMDYCYEHGVNFWDTADMYNGGESEKIVSKALKGRREDIILATKVFYPPSQQLNDRGLSRRHIMKAIDGSLKRLDTDYVDIYYMHAPDYETGLDETLDTLSTLVRSGKVHYLGVSNYASWQVADILGLCERKGYIKPIISQNIYNLLLRDVEQELVPCLKAHGMGIAVYNPIAGGFLTGKYKSRTLPENTRLVNNKTYKDRYWSEDNFKALEKFEAIAQKNGINLLELALRWTINRPAVNTLIGGVSKLEQIKANIAVMDNTGISEEAIKACDEVWYDMVGKRFAYNR